MMNNNTLVNSVCRHTQHKTVMVNHFIENSRTVVDVTVIDRGPGWNDFNRDYTGVKSKNGWMRGENRDFGNHYQVHKNSLTKIDSDEI